MKHITKSKRIIYPCLGCWSNSPWKMPAWYYQKCNKVVICDHVCDQTTRRAESRAACRGEGRSCLIPPPHQNGLWAELTCTGCGCLATSPQLSLWISLFRKVRRSKVSVKLRSLNPYRADIQRFAKEGSRVAEYEEMLHDREPWGIISQESWKMTHFLGYSWPDQGKTQNQCLLNSKLWLAGRHSPHTFSICSADLCEDSPRQVVSVTSFQGRRTQSFRESQVCSRARVSCTPSLQSSQWSHTQKRCPWRHKAALDTWAYGFAGPTCQGGQDPRKRGQILWQWAWETFTGWDLGALSPTPGSRAEQ